MSKKWAKIMAISFSYQLSFSIIVATFGLESGIISNEVYTAILLAVVLSALVPSLFMKIGKGREI